VLILRGLGKAGSLKMENGREVAMPEEHGRRGEETEKQRTKEGAPFSAALKDNQSITHKVLAANIY
jgi:hypothetical protein